MERMGLYEINVFDSEWELVIEYYPENNNQKNAVEEIYNLFSEMGSKSKKIFENIRLINDIIKMNGIKYEWVQNN